jgi:hypothetical protein
MIFWCQDNIWSTLASGRNFLVCLSSSLFFPKWVLGYGIQLTLRPHRRKVQPGAINYNLHNVLPTILSTSDFHIFFTCTLCLPRAYPFFFYIMANHSLASGLNLLQTTRDSRGTSTQREVIYSTHFYSILTKLTIS